MKKTRFIECRKCSRKQGIADAQSTGGITEIEAHEIGWRHEKDGWLCPFCIGWHSSVSTHRIEEKNKINRSIYDRANA
jgi:hypothetical protein